MKCTPKSEYQTEDSDYLESLNGPEDYNLQQQQAPLNLKSERVISQRAEEKAVHKRESNDEEKFTDLSQLLDPERVEGGAEYSEEEEKMLEEGFDVVDIEEGEKFPESDRVLGQEDLSLAKKKQHKITEFDDQKFPVIADPVKHHEVKKTGKNRPLRPVAKAVMGWKETALEKKSLELVDFGNRRRKRRYAPGVKDHGDSNPSIGQLIPQMMIDHNGRPVPVKGRFTSLPQ